MFFRLAEISVIILLFITFPTLTFAQTIHEAAEKGDLETVKSMLKNNPELLNDFSGSEGRCPLHSAIRGKHSDVAVYLIGRGADVNARTPYGSSVMNYAAYWGLADIAELLIEKGADVKNDSNRGGATPLYMAAAAQNREIAELLLKHGSDVNKKIVTGSTALMRAAVTGNIKIVKLLVGHGAEIDVREKMNGVTPLFKAVQRGHKKVTEFLLSKGANSGIKGKDGKTIIFAAAESGISDMLHFIINNVDSVNDKEKVYGMTPLHKCSISGFEESVKLLVENGAEINPGDNKGNTPLYYAIKYGHSKIAGLLESKGGYAGSIKKETGFTPLLNKKLNNKEAVIWYLGHSGWAVKTKHRILVFDYHEYEKAPENQLLSNGRINPEELKDLDVYVFVSHEHSDHFYKKIFEWKKSIKNIKYIFGWKVMDDPEYTYLEKTQDFIKIDDVEIFKINSRIEPGGAFLVKSDGVTIYHSGDYLGEKEDANMEFLAGNTEQTDIVFIETIAARNESVDAIKKLKPNAVFPMHARKREFLLKRFVNENSGKYPDITFQSPDFRGDRYFYSGGKLTGL